MNKSHHYQEKDEIDLSALIRRLWKEKILILIFSIACMLLFYLYTLTFDKEFKTEIVIQDPAYEVLKKYDKFVSNKKNINTIEADKIKTEVNVVTKFIDDFNLNLLSLDNLENFVEQSKELDDFKVFLKKRNISAKNYFRGYRFGELKEKNKTIYNRYFIIFPKELEGTIFLNNYLEFNKNKTKGEFINKLGIAIHLQLTEFEQNLQIAIQIGLEDPVMKFIESSPNNFFADVKSSYLEGTKVLSQKIIYTKELLLDLERNQFDYNPILDKASVISKVAPFYQLLYILGGFVFGFFLSLIIIFFRDVIKNK
jgi:LPS O-antigen subunit length determinant protein (WzzB/FepE family)